MAVVSMIVGAAVGFFTAAMLTDPFYDLLNTAGVNGTSRATLFSIANAGWYMVWIGIFVIIAKQVA